MIVWDVDTQVDFMHADGRVYVPGAEETVPAMERLVEAARGRRASSTSRPPTTTS